MNIMTQNRQARAIVLTAIMVCSVVASTGVVVATDTAATDDVTATVEAQSPSVEIVNDTINDDTETTLHLQYNPGSTDISNVSLTLSGPPTNRTAYGLHQRANATTTSFNTTLTQSGGTLAITVPAHTFGGGTIPLTAELRTETDHQLLGTDTQTFDIGTTITLRNSSISPTSVAPGESVTVSATLENTGNTADDFVVYANTSQRVVDGTFVTVDGNTDRTVTFNISNDYETTQSLSVSGSERTDVQWANPVVISNRSVSATTITTGQNLTLRATVNNTGSSEATRTVRFSVDDHHETKSVTVAAGATATVTSNVSVDEAGGLWPMTEHEPVSEVTVKTRYEVRNTSVEPSTIDIGDSATVTTTLTNPTDEWVNETVTVRVAGGSYSRNVSLAAGENTTISGDVTPDTVRKSTIGVADTWTETTLTVNGVLQVPDESVSVNRSSIDAGESVAVGFTYRNPNDSGRTVDRTIRLSAGGDSEQVDITLEPGETQQVNRTLEPTRAGGGVEIRAGWLTLASITVNSPVVVENVSYDRVVAAGDTASVVYTLNNTASSVQSRDLSVHASLNDGTSVSDRTTAELAAGETRNVTLDLQMEDPGGYWAGFTSRADGGIAVLNDTTGEANVTVDIRPTKSVSVRNEARFYVNVSNNGTADAGQPVTLRRTPDGEILDEDVAYAKAGGSDLTSVSMEFGSAGEKTVYINGKPQNITVTEPYIQETNISVVNGTVPRTMPVAEGGYDRGYLNVEFRINEERASAYDLARIGADRTTRFKIEMTVRDFDPSTVIATGKNVEWNSTSLSNNRTRITLYLSPVHQSYLENAPSLQEWDDGQRTATSTIENMVRFRVYGDSPDSNRDFYWTEGLAVSTNAQSFSAPHFYNTSDGRRFEVLLAAPHFREDGSVNQGHYTAVLPDEMLDRWNVTSAAELEAAYTGANDTTIDITETADGMRVHISLHYSSGTARVGEVGAVDGGSGTPGTGDGTTDSEESAPDEGGEESEPDTGSSGGGGGQSGTVDRPSVRTVPTTSGATVVVRDVSATTPFTADLTEVSSDAVELESLTFDFTFDSDDFRIEATTPTATPQGTAELPAATAISYFDLDAIGIEADTMDHAQLTVQVSEDALPAGTSNDDVVMFHFADGEWETLETEYLGEGRFAANTTSFSAFAVGVPSSTSTPSTPQPTESGAEETESPATATQSEDTETAAEHRTETTTEAPGFGVVVTVLALLSVALAARRDR